MKKSRTIFIIILASVIVSGILFSFYVNSKISSMKALRVSLSELEKKNKNLIEENIGGITNLDKLVPDESGITEFVETVYRSSEQNGIVNLTFVHNSKEFIDLSSGRILRAMPISGQIPEVIYSYPVRIAFNAGYRDLAEFVRELQNLDRLVTIENLKINRDKNTLAVNMVLNVYSREDR